jgi:16S rRNA (guanine966-N2)-methyltransferase
MRIVGGRWGGRKLVRPRGGDLRPTSDRVREALFSLLGDVGDARVLDLFCGTGALGLEALSRGAAHATFVDTRTATVARNIQALDARDRATLVRADARRFLAETADRFDLILCDPPYRLADRLGPALAQPLFTCLATGGRLVVESDARAPLELGVSPADERAYGETLIRIYRDGGESP